MAGHNSRTVFHWKPLGNSRWTFGVYTWSRQGSSRFSDLVVTKRGLVCRVGPLGHVQVQKYAVPHVRDGRVPRRTVMLSWWGITGRRRKRYIEIAVGR